MSDLLEAQEEVAASPQRAGRLTPAQAKQLYGEPMVRRKPRIPAKADDEIKAMIERKLSTPGGVTERELGAYIQQRRGTDTSPEAHDSPVRQKELKAIEQAEIGACMKIAMEYITKTYG